jgi:hypothetical protein
MLMGDENVYELPPSVDNPQRDRRFLVSAPHRLGRRVSHQHLLTYNQNCHILSEHTPVGGLVRYIESVTSFCFVMEFTNELKADPRFMHLAEWNLKYVCHCLLFQRRIMCPGCVFMQNRLSLLASPIPLLLTIVYCGRCQDIRMRGRRRTRAPTNTSPGSLNDVAGSFGLPADYSSPKLDYLRSLTTLKLTNICRICRVSPRSENRTMANLIQSIIAGTTF